MEDIDIEYKVAGDFIYDIIVKHGVSIEEVFENIEKYINDRESLKGITTDSSMMDMLVPLKYETVLEVCYEDRHMKNLCDSEKFWKRYYNHHYGNELFHFLKKYVDFNLIHADTYKDKVEMMNTITNITIDSEKNLVLPENIGSLLNVKTLSITNSGVKKIPLSIGDMINLNVVDMSRNKIKNLNPNIFFRLTKLKYLNLEQE